MGLFLTLMPGGIRARSSKPGCSGLPPPGGRLNRACGTGDTRRLRSGRHGGPDKGGVNPGPPAVRRGHPNSPVWKRAEATAMLAAMKRTTFGLRKEITVYEYERGLLYREGKLDRVLEPGRYTFWASEPVDVAKVSLREMSHVVAGQGILTADRIEVRLSLVAQYRVTDPVLALNSVENYVEQLHQELQLVLRDLIARRTLDEVLDGRTEMATELHRLSAEPAKRYGVEVNRVGIRDVILPGEVRQVMMQEVQAERAGRADLVKARHEVAAARARANTAKILSENPEVARLQELDALVNLAGKNGTVVLLPTLADLFVPRRNAESGK